MDIEKLKSIIRLANNNPNENEANLAARKACRILAENDFALLRTPRTAADKLNQHASNYGGSSTGRNTGTWNDVKRSTEPFWKSSYYRTDPNPYSDEWFRRWDSYWKKAEDNPVYGSYSSSNWNDDNPPKKQSFKRKCTRCGLEIDTFRIKEEPFVCNPCHWQDKP